METDPRHLGVLSLVSLFWLILHSGSPIVPGAFKMLPYIVTIVVLVAVSLRKSRENEPPASLGLAYFREER
jgi:simple sugar transport system permease protein